MSSIEVVPSVFRGPDRPGDFAWMIEQREYGDAFFVFNDNEEQFLAHQRDPTAPAGCSPGAGNAAIRPWQCATPPRASGIPTGSGGGGYNALTPEVRAVVDRAVATVRDKVETHGYRRVYFSSDGAGGLGSGTFRIAGDVKAYIVERIGSLAEPR